MKRNKPLPFAVALSLALMSTHCLAPALAQPPQPPEPLLVENFDNGTPWIALGEGAKVSAATNKENIREGQGALRFDYEVQPKQLAALIGPLTPGTLSTLQSLHFWIKADSNSSFILSLQEEGGGRFSTFFATVKNQWQQVEFTPSNFLLQDGDDDPKDTDGTLDLGKIEAVALMDFSPILAELAAKSELSKHLNVQTGAHTFYLDEVTFSGKALAPASSPSEGAVNLDVFERPQISWIGVGNVAVSRWAGKTPADNALQADYVQQSSKFFGLFKPLPRGVLAGKSRLTFQATSRRNAVLVVQLEETSGGKYNASIPLSGDATPTSIDLAFADFKAADDSKDDNDRLDLKQVKQIAVFDIAGMLAMSEGENTLWLKALRAQ